ncbi:hypothetical protein OCK72_05245 [Fusobacterium simiae]|uniref:Uncharacterized protein n=1 Tax=Fusobacterium simiae TaxID=855 RepID=A0ABT4DKN0_FUSSI|nr:hypothetical protein [Fusobacterium simiae]MCY7008061.1 hypothetical protein [Fusobacterium simiae]
MFTKRNIYEYDIYKANISCLLEMGEINQEQYNMLSSIPKVERSKFVNSFERLEKDTATDYRKFVVKALEKFKKLNDIKEENIIEIAFDAIWLDKEVDNLQVTDNIKFTCKRKATSILEIKKVKFYFNSVDNTFFQRGLGKKESPWFEIIKEYMRLSEIEDTGNLKKFINDFKEKYVDKELDDNFYQRLIPKMDNLELLKILLY